MLLRHLLSILLLPFMVVVVVPSMLLGRGAADILEYASPRAIVRMAAGVALFLGGLALFAWAVRLFATVGRGTIAPWDPTRHLVAVGPYRYVRNPMISGVAFMLVGEALFWGSRALAVWAAAFLLINHAYFLLSEEPGLERRFGQAYLEYKACVPRWIPRARSWTRR